MRTIQLNIRLTEEEFGDLQGWSEAEHLSVAQYVRSALFGSGRAVEPVFGEEDKPRKKDETAVLADPSPPKKRKSGLCPTCLRKGNGKDPIKSCGNGCWEKRAKLATEVFDVEGLEGK